MQVAASIVAKMVVLLEAVSELFITADVYAANTGCYLDANIEVTPCGLGIAQFIDMLMCACVNYAFPFVVETTGGLAITHIHS